MANRNLYTSGVVSLNANSATVSFSSAAESLYIYNRDAANDITCTIEGAVVTVGPGYCKKADCVTSSVSVACAATALVEVYAFEDAEALFDFKPAGGGAADTGEVVESATTAGSPHSVTETKTISRPTVPAAAFFQLPAAGSATTYADYIVKDGAGIAGSGHPITVTAAGGTIDGAASDSISSDYGAKVYVSDGTNWNVI